MAKTKRRKPRGARRAAKLAKRARRKTNRGSRAKKREDAPSFEWEDPEWPAFDEDMQYEAELVLRDALDADWDEDRLALAQQALQISPYLPDAWVLLAQEADVPPGVKEMYVAFAVKAARGLGA